MKSHLIQSFIYRALMTLGIVSIIAVVAVPVTVSAQASTTSTNKPTSKSQCLHDGWKKYGFKNQGKCIEYVENHDHHTGYGHDGDDDHDGDRDDRNHDDRDGDDHDQVGHKISKFFSDELSNVEHFKF